MNIKLISKTTVATAALLGTSIAFAGPSAEATVDGAASASTPAGAINGSVNSATTATESALTGSASASAEGTTSSTDDIAGDSMGEEGSLNGDAQEFANGEREMRNPDLSNPRNAFSSLDTNGNGMITLPEASGSATVSAQFAASDENGDNMLSSDEFDELASGLSDEMDSDFENTEDDIEEAEEE